MVESFIILQKSGNKAQRIQKLHWTRAAFRGVRTLRYQYDSMRRGPRTAGPSKGGPRECCPFLGLFFTWRLAAVLFSSRASLEMPSSCRHKRGHFYDFLWDSSILRLLYGTSKVLTVASIQLHGTGVFFFFSKIIKKYRKRFVTDNVF